MTKAELDQNLNRRAPTADEINTMIASRKIGQRESDEERTYREGRHPKFRHPSEPVPPTPPPRRRPNHADRIAIEDNSTAYALWRRGEHPEFLNDSQQPGPHDQQDPPSTLSTPSADQATTDLWMGMGGGFTGGLAEARRLAIRDAEYGERMARFGYAPSESGESGEAGPARPIIGAAPVPRPPTSDPLSTQPMGNYMPPGATADLRPSAVQAAEAKAKGKE